MVADGPSFGGEPVLGCPGEAGGGLRLPAGGGGRPQEPRWEMRPCCWLRVIPARSRQPRLLPPSHPSLPPCACRLSLSPCSPGAGSLLPGTAWLGEEPDSSRPGPGRCWRRQPHLVAPAPTEGGRWHVAGMQCVGAGPCLGPQPSAAPCPKLEAAPGCAVLGGSSVVRVSPWLVMLQPGLRSRPCTREGFVPRVTCVLALCMGTTSALLTPCPVTAACPYVLQTPPPCSWPPRAVSALSLAACPPGRPSQVNPQHLRGGSRRWHRGSRGDTEGERLE